MIEIDVEHWHAVKSPEPGATRCEPFQWAQECSRIVGPIAELEQNCWHEETRSINWPQSFARKGLPIASYVPMKKSGFLEYRFKRIKGADTSLPRSVCFSEASTQAEMESSSPLRGDVLTYVHTELHLWAKCQAQESVQVDPNLLQSLQSIGHIVTDVSVLIPLVKCLPKRRQKSFRDRFFRNWTSNLSFYMLHY